MSPIDHRLVEGESGSGSQAEKVFGWLWVAGALFAGAALALLALLPPLPSDIAGMASWVDDGITQLQWSGEFLFFAVLCWGAGAVGAFGQRDVGSKLRLTIALVAMGVSLVSFLIALLVLGRLAYPVADLGLAADTAFLLAGLVLGTVHLALLALVVVVTASPAPGRAVGPWAGALVRSVFGCLFFVGSFPWLLPTWVNLVVAGAVACWGALVGVAVVAEGRRSRLVA